MAWRRLDITRPPRGCEGRASRHPAGDPVVVLRNAARNRHEGARTLCLAALVVVMMLTACTGENDRVVALGSLDDIEMGSVRTFHDMGGDSGSWEELPAGAA